MTDQIRPLLGQFAFWVLVAVDNLGHDSYGASIERYIHDNFNRDPAIGQVYVTLNRLEKRKVLRSNLSPPTPVKGGRARKVFSITEDLGARVLAYNTAVRAKRSSGKGDTYLAPPPELSPATTSAY